MATYIEVSIKDSEDVYYVPNLNVRDKREALQKVMSLLSPVIGDTVGAYQKYNRDQVRLALSPDVDSVDEVEDAEFDIFSIFAVLGSQLSDDQVVEAQDVLIKGIRVSKAGPSNDVGNLPLYDVDDEEDLNTYMKLLKVSFTQNVYTPFMQCLDDMGYSEIVGNVQALLKTHLAA